MNAGKSAGAVQARLELLWWLATFMITALVLLPIYNSLDQAFPFYAVNIVFVVAFITLTRYIFLLRHTFLAERPYFKLAIIFLCIPAVFLLVQEINGFQVYLDENGYESIVGTLAKEEQMPMMSYIRNEMLLFGVGAAIACTLFPLRLVLSIWRRYNGKPD